MATLNINDKSAYVTLTNDTIVSTGSALWGSIRGTEPIVGRRVYFEVLVINVAGTGGGGRRFNVGVANKDQPLNTYNGSSANGRSWQPSLRELSPGAIIYGIPALNTQTISVLVDMIDGRLEFWVDGVSQGVAFSNLLSLNEAYPMFSLAASGASIQVLFNVEDFKYGIPVGYSTYPSTSKMLLEYNEEYYTYKNNLWTSLGNALPSYSEFMQNGVKSIGIEINDFIINYGSNFKIFVGSDSIKTSSLKITANPNPQILSALSDISLTGIEAIDKITLLSTGNVKVAVSFDSAVTWLAYKNGIWESIENAHTGMTNLELNALTSQQLELGRNGSSQVRFSYSLVDSAEVDNIELKISLQGHEELARTNTFDVSYDEATSTIKYDIKKSSSFSVNYVDSN